MATEMTFEELVRNGSPMRLRVRVAALLGQVDSGLGTEYRARFIEDAKGVESWAELVKIAHRHAIQVLAADLNITQDADFYLAISPSGDTA